MERELYDKYIKLVSEYYNLRDAKSDGCCYEMSLSEVIEYDNKIEITVKAMNDAYKAYLAYIHA